MRSGESCLKTVSDAERNGYKMDYKNIRHSEAPYKFEPHMHKINGTIANAISKYEDNRVSLRQLLTDYNDVITYPEYLKKQSIRGVFKQGIKKQTVVCGVAWLRHYSTSQPCRIYRQNQWM